MDNTQKAIVIIFLAGMLGALGIVGLGILSEELKTRHQERLHADAGVEE